MSRTAIITLIICLLYINSSAAETFEFNYMISKGLHSNSLLGGYGENHKIPSSTDDRFGFDMISYRFSTFRSNRSDYGLQIMAGNKLTDNEQFAISAIGDFRQYFMNKGRVSLAYGLGFGLIHTNKAIDGIATKTNFTEQFSLTCHYSLAPKTALTLEYRFMHVSNANIVRPNRGFNASVVSIGATWFN